MHYCDNMDENLNQLKEEIKDDILSIINSYTHGIPTYNNTFRTKILSSIDNNFSSFCKDYVILTERDAKAIFFRQMKLFKNHNLKRILSRMFPNKKVLIVDNKDGSQTISIL